MNPVGAPSRAKPTATLKQEPPTIGLGRSLQPADAVAKTSGTVPYAADLWAEGRLCAAGLRSPDARTAAQGRRGGGSGRDADPAARKHYSSPRVPGR